MPTERRLVNVPIDASILEVTLFPHPDGWFWRVDAGLPEGAIRVATWHDPIYDRIYFTFFHESFDIVRDGQPIPMFRGVRLSSHRALPNTSSG